MFKDIWLSNVQKENETRLTVYPTLVLPDDTIDIFFERTKMRRCALLLEGVATLVMICYVFDVRFAPELVNSFNFLDVHVGQVDKKSRVWPTVQRKLNVLLAV